MKNTIRVVTAMVFLAVSCLLVKDGEQSPVVKLIDSITSTQSQVWIVGAVTIILFLAILGFLLLPFCKSACRGIRKILAVVITLALTQLILLAPTNANAWVPIVTDDSVVILVKETNDQSASNSIEADLTLEKDGLSKITPNNTEVNRLADEALVTLGFSGRTVVDQKCAWQIIIVIIFILGVAYVVYKIVKACMALGKKKKKQSGDDPEESTRRSPSRSEGDVVLAAAFFSGFVPQTAEDENDCGCLAPFSFEYTVSTPITGSSGVSSYLPVNLIDVDEYLLRYRLSTDALTNSFSVNGIPTNSLPSITYSNRLVTAKLEGKENVTLTIERSTNMVVWEYLPSISIPNGSHLRFEDNSLPRTVPAAFYRVSVVQ